MVITTISCATISNLAGPLDIKVIISPTLLIKTIRLESFSYLRSQSSSTTSCSTGQSLALFNKTLSNLGSGTHR